MIELQEKELSQKRKFKNFVARCWIPDPIARGSKVWKQLDAQLPKAVGACVTDEPRVNEFKKLAEKLPFLDHYALKVWLKYRYNEMEEGTFGIVTGSVEQYCVKWMQIYSEHYNVME